MCGAKGHVRFGSKADIWSAKRHVRFTPNNDRESGLSQTVMSALPPKADMCGARAYVCFGPIADSQPHPDELLKDGRFSCRCTSITTSLWPRRSMTTQPWSDNWP
jgi:hypothetical protein